MQIASLKFITPLNVYIFVLSMKYAQLTNKRWVCVYHNNKL